MRSVVLGDQGREGGGAAGGDLGYHCKGGGEGDDAVEKEANMGFALRVDWGRCLLICSYEKNVAKEE